MSPTMIAAMLEIASTPVRRSRLLMTTACRAVSASKAAPRMAAVMWVERHFSFEVTVRHCAPPPRSAAVGAGFVARSSQQFERSGPIYAHGYLQAMRRCHPAREQGLRGVRHVWRHGAGPAGLDGTERGSWSWGAGFLVGELGGQSRGDSQD